MRTTTATTPTTRNKKRKLRHEGSHLLLSLSTTLQHLNNRAMLRQVLVAEGQINNHDREGKSGLRKQGQSPEEQQRERRDVELREERRERSEK